MIKEIDIRMSDRLFGLRDAKTILVSDFPFGIRTTDVAPLNEVPLVKFRTNSYIKIYETINTLIKEHGVKEIYYQLRPTQLYVNEPRAQAVCQAYFVVDGEVVY